MATQKPLIEMVPEIMHHFENNKDYLEFNYRIYKIMEGQLREEIECSLQKEVSSAAAFKRIIERIPSINVLRKAVDKLSKIYVEKPSRMVDKDQDIFDELQRITNVDRQLIIANMFYNSQHSFAIEPYIKDRKQKLRILGAHQFLPYSDDISDPANMTVMIKILDKETIHREQEVDRNGRKTIESVTEDVLILGLYSDTEFLIIDSSGGIRRDKMRDMGLTDTKHDFGTIPFLYKSRTPNQLIPFPNREGFDMAILIPKLLTDLNYASQFLSKSIIWTRNAKIEGQELNPDTVVDLGDRTEENGDPEIGTIDPKVDIPNQLKLIETQVGMYFSSIGIKSTPQISQGKEASGVSKSIDEGDTTSEKKVQMEFFRCVENELWEMMASVHNNWARKNLVDENRTLAVDFHKTFRIQFAEMRAAKTDKQKLEEIQLWRDQKLMTRKQALRSLRPDFTEKQIGQWISELDKESEEEMDKMMDFGGSIQAGRTGDGTFSEGNSEAKNAPENRLEAEENKLNE